MIRSLALLALAALTVTTASAQDVSGRRERTHTWSERVPSGAWLRVYTFNGRITVTAADGGVAEVRATKRVQSPGTVEDIGFEARRDGANVTFCALWRDTTSCDDTGLHMRGSGARDAAVDLDVQLPRGVLLRIASGNGELAVDGAAAEVVASSGNGRVTVRGGGPVRAASGNGAIDVRGARGPVRASTGNGRVLVSAVSGPVTAASGNGDLDVSMTTLAANERQAAGDEMTFSTGNGRVRVALPTPFDADVDATTGHGTIRSDLPLTVQGRLTPSRLRGTIGAGGQRLRLRTGNGDIELVRADERRER